MSPQFAQFPPLFFSFASFYDCANRVVARRGEKCTSGVGSKAWGERGAGGTIERDEINT